MEKHLKTLEQNVQWIALALGGLYLLYMIYAYVITPPVTVKLGTGPSAPALTPGEVDETIAKKYAEPLRTAMSRTDTLDIKVTDVMGPYLARIDEKDLKTPDLATAWGGVRGEVPGVVVNEGNKNALIAQAPVPPPPIAVASSSNIASIVLPGAGGQNGNAVAPAGAQALPPHKDTGWCSLTFKVPFADLQKAWGVFDNPNLPQLVDTKFLKVTLTREEMLPNGQWSKGTVIDPVGLANPVSFPGPTVPSGNDVLRKQAAEYARWAGTAQPELTEPAFPEVIPGVRVWYAPGQAAPDPTKKQRNGQFGAPARPRPALNAPPPVQVAAPNPNAWNAAQPRAIQPGAGEFNVMKLGQDLDLMVHDTNAVPGHTYRYQVQYSLSNPTWDSANLAVQKVADTFALESQPSAWTQPVTIPSTTQMFVVNVSSQTQSVRFDVFEWKDGKMTRSTVNATPGDAVKDETVVDIRQDTGKHDASYVLLVGPNGTLSRQDKQGDAANPDYDKLKAEVALQQDQQGSPYGRQQALAR
ncbi:MAG TPA: hypothetical protein VFW23_00035 [Tepidisphaeraceae bacterium]|nr:hypothetical protein [Tepidisphaeraceae bacterium]